MNNGIFEQVYFLNFGLPDPEKTICFSTGKKPAGISVSTKAAGLINILAEHYTMQ
jgi:hypothetical protein